MKWTCLFSERLRKARMVAVSWATIHHEASPMAQPMSVLGIDIAKLQTPPDLVVKFQLIDIVAVILWLVLRLHFVYQRQIEG
jgi:hypothetical protein